MPDSIQSSNTNILIKIGSGFGLIMLLIAVMLAMSLYGTHKLAKLTNLSYKHPLTVSNALRDLNSNILKIQIQIDELSSHRNEINNLVAFARLDSCETEIERLFDVVEMRYLGPAENVTSARDAFKNWKNKYRSALNMITGNHEIDSDHFRQLHDASIMEPIIVPIAAMTDFARNKADFLLDESQITVKRVRTGVVGFFVILILLTGLTGYVVIRRVNDDIKKMSAIEKNLHETNKMDSIGRLAGGVAHDFNNMLMPIIAYSDLMLHDTSVGDEQRDMLEQIKKAGTRAADLTKQLLAFSRKQILEVKVMNLNDLILDTEKMLRRLVMENIELTTILNPELNKIKSDRAQMDQILMNLVVNARDAMPNGGKILIETSNVYLSEKYASRHEEVIPGQYILMAISDTGKGMDHETLERIFEPFYTTKEKGKGTGLGLSTIYGIVKQHGGHINVYSEIDHGSTFKVYIPAIDEQPEPDGEPLSHNAKDIQKVTVRLFLLPKTTRLCEKW